MCPLYSVSHSVMDLFHECACCVFIVLEGGKICVYMCTFLYDSSVCVTVSTVSDKCRIRSCAAITDVVNMSCQVCQPVQNDPRKHNVPDQPLVDLWIYLVFHFKFLPVSVCHGLNTVIFLCQSAVK